jgi:predicted transcriptional regulator YheO
VNEPARDAERNTGRNVGHDADGDAERMVGGNAEREAVRGAEQDAVLAALRPVVDGIAATFGPVCEVVLHDYRRPERSVVAVAGSVTGRSVGGAMSEIGMRMLARGDEARDELNYVTRTTDGTLLKSSTIALRDSTGAVFGALCVNLDVTAVDRAQALLGALAGTAGALAEPPATTFGDDIDKVVDAIVDAHPLRRDRSWAALDRDRRLELFRDLDGRGVFAVRRSVEQVAARLGISRASAYTYLARARAEAGPATDPAGGHA